jgi:hypothetical protein
VGFKSNREFLRNVSIGAVGTRRVAAVLKQGGYQIIELERYCSSNKIWATKIKRLRVPDLLCLRSGIRIESRGKSSLEVSVSHAVNNPDRAWDKGLRDTDLIAFVKCSPHDDTWTASDRVALFRVGEMRATVAEAGLSRMKSAAEGSEIRLTWPATVPGTAGTVTGVSAERIDTLLSTGRKQTYRLARKSGYFLMPYVTAGDMFSDGDTVIASLMPTLVSTTALSVPQYDFTADLASDQSENVYVAVKALGFLPDQGRHAIPQLENLARTHPDPRIKLEAAASLARLGERTGWELLEETALDLSGDLSYRMETALILAELPFGDSLQLLNAIALSPQHESELRAAAVWGLSSHSDSLTGLLSFISDQDELVAVHAIVGAARLIEPMTLAHVLQSIRDDNREAAGLARAVLSSQCDFIPEALAQLRSAPAVPRRQWLLYLLAAAGRKRCESVIRSTAPDLMTELEFYWTHQADNWTNRLDVADQIDYLEEQS